MNLTWRVLVGDVREQLRTLPDACVQTCVTSPPYWGLRDYGHAGQIGLESTPDAYIASMVDVFAEVWRVLKDDGTLWLNLGDSYGRGERVNNPSDVTRGQTGNTGQVAAVVAKAYGRGTVLPNKNLVGIPWRVAFALQSFGWYLRSDIIWHKPNPMPESVTDRPTKSHEYVFLLSKSERYFYDSEAVSEPSLRAGDIPGGGRAARNAIDSRVAFYRPENTIKPVGDNRNARSVWTIATQPYPEAHFATFPEALPERCIKAGSRQGDTVLDPFTGSGTTGHVALKLGRSFIGCELNPAYVELARKRIGNAAPLFSHEGDAV